jgi:hypothetical protein
LGEGFVLQKLFSTPVQKANMSISPCNNLTPKLKHKAQDTMCRRVLGPEIKGEVFYIREAGFS